MIHERHHKSEDCPYILKREFLVTKGFKGSSRNGGIFNTDKPNKIFPTNVLHETPYNVSINWLQTIFTAVVLMQCKSNIWRHTRWKFLGPICAHHMIIEPIFQSVKFLLNQSWPQPLNQFTGMEPSCQLCYSRNIEDAY